MCPMLHQTSGTDSTSRASEDSVCLGLSISVCLMRSKYKAIRWWSLWRMLAHVARHHPSSRTFHAAISRPRPKIDTTSRESGVSWLKGCATSHHEASWYQSLTLRVTLDIPYWDSLQCAPVLLDDIRGRPCGFSCNHQQTSPTHQHAG